MGSVTIADVAKKAGVSKATVSNYLNKRFEKMAPETISIIEHAVKELHYTPDLSARRLANKEKSRTICLLIPGNLPHIFDSMYYPTVFRSIDKYAIEKKYNTLIHTREGLAREDEMTFLISMGRSLVDGYIIFDLDDNDRYFKEFDRVGIPYVCVGKFEKNNTFNYVASDHKKAVEDAIKYLLQLSHKKIGYISPQDSGAVECSRKEGIREICFTEHVSENTVESYFMSHGMSDTQIFERCLEILRQEDRPTAYILPQSLVPQFKLAANHLNLRIPKDISYIDIEHYKSYKLDDDQQTRIDSRANEIARIAFDELLRHVYQPSDSDISQITLPLSLVVGNTTAVFSKEGKK